MRDLEEKTRLENKDLMEQNKEMKQLLGAEKKDQEVQVEIITLENYTHGILDVMNDPDTKFKLNEITG